MHLQFPSALTHTHTPASVVFNDHFVLHLLLMSGREMGGISSLAFRFHRAPLSPSSITGSQAEALLCGWRLALDLKHLSAPGAPRIKGPFCSRTFDECVERQIPVSWTFILWGVLLRCSFCLYFHVLDVFLFLHLCLLQSKSQRCFNWAVSWLVPSHLSYHWIVGSFTQ